MEWLACNRRIPFFQYYEPMSRDYPGEYQSDLDELDLLKGVVLSHTPRISITKQLFIQFMMDVYHFVRAFETR